MRKKVPSLDRFTKDQLRTLRQVLPSKAESKRELRWLRAELPSPTSHRVMTACKLRSASFPLQYILGSQPFGGLSVLCRPGVLIPRQETEEWVMELVRLIVKYRHRSAGNLSNISGRIGVADLCTGTGCILFALNHGLGGIDGVGVDISRRAEALFAKNLKHLGMHNLCFVHSDVKSSLPIPKGSLRLLTANPPYILTNEKLPKSVMFEPRLALYGNLDFYSACVDRALELAVEAAVIEVSNAVQADYTASRFQERGWEALVRLDGYKRTRSVWAWRTPNWSFLSEAFKDQNSVC